MSSTSPEQYQGDLLRAESIDLDRPAAAPSLAGRLEALHAVTVGLTAAQTSAAAGDVLLPAGMRALGAAGALFAIVGPDGAHLEVVRARMLPPAVLTELQPARPAGGPLANVLRSQEPVWLSEPEAVARYPQLAAVSAAAGLGAWAIVPLRVDAGPCGVLALAFTAPQRFSPDDQAFLVTLAGLAAATVVRARQAEELQRHAARMQALAEAAQAFAQAGQDLEAVLSQVARRVSELVGGACALRLIEPDGQHLRLAALYHPDAELAGAARELLSSSPQRVDEGVSALVLARGEPVLLPAIDPIALRASVRPVFHPHLDRWPVRSILTVPLRARDGAFGLLSMTRYAGESSYTLDDQAFLLELADRAALAIANVRLYSAAEQARAAAERAAAQTLRLQTLTAALAEALTPEDVMAIVADQVGVLVGPTSGAIGLVSADGQALELAQMVGYAPGELARWERQPLSAAGPGADVVRGGAAQFWETRAAFVARYPELAGAALRSEAWAIVPLRAEGQTIGVLSLGFQAPRAFDEDTRLLLELLAQQCATALQRTQRYYVLERARTAAAEAADRTARLYAVTAALAEALTIDEVAEVIVRQGIAALGASSGSVRQLNPDGAALVALQVVGYPPRLAAEWQTIPLDAPVPMAEAARSAQPILIETPAQVAADWPQFVDAMAALNYQAVALLPLTVAGRTIGTMSFGFATPRIFASEDRSFLEAMARQCAVALERARFYQQAQEAIQTRDQFLSIAAHELKTPLTALSGQAQLLQRRLRRGEQALSRLARSVDVIAQQADRLDGMVHALLDVGRLEHGQFVLERQPLDLRALIGGVVDESRLGLDAHALVYDPPPAPIVVAGDQLRLEQVLQNLVGNAVKYSPAGGTISVRVERRGGRAAIVVADEGVGIPAAALPQLFQRFYRAANVSAHHISGMGIGLYVVREIVSRHGGTVEVASTEGAGSVFTVLLPLAEAEAAGGAQ